MTLNLIEDPWIPVRCVGNVRRVVAPWQISEPDVLAPDWPRADLNIGCYEFLIGLVFLVDPPETLKTWKARKTPDPERLRARLSHYASAFELLGDGPRFLQDFEELTGEPEPVDMLFIDSAGRETAKKNADLLVHRGRYANISLPLAAMALYTFQAYAPAGGQGNRTSMRGGGPLVTLINPEGNLWDLVWANVPLGKPSSRDVLPWMRPTRTSEKRQFVLPDECDSMPAEVFFGMPRRLRLVGGKAGVSGVVQRPWGTNYAMWKHPLSPYYRLKPGGEWLPKHPRAGYFGYRNWLGVLLDDVKADRTEIAACLRDWSTRDGTGSVIVAGWAMDKMKPRDFVFSERSFLRLSQDEGERLVGFIMAAEEAASALCQALDSVLVKGEAREVVREAFFRETEFWFLQYATDITRGEYPAEAWLSVLTREAWVQFNRVSLAMFLEKNFERIKAISGARRNLGNTLAGFGKMGANIYNALEMVVPAQKKGEAA